MFDNSQVSDITVMKPEPCKEGCELVSMTRTLENSVIFEFKDATGAVLNHREFIPKKLDMMSDEDFKKSINLSVSRIAHIARAFLSEEEFLAIKVEGDSDNLAKAGENWLEYIKKTGLALGLPNAPKFKGVKCSLKVVYVHKKGKYYSALPKVPAFISTANHPKQFVTNPQYDIYEIPTVQPDAEALNLDNGGGVDNFGESAGAPTPNVAPSTNDKPEW